MIKRRSLLGATAALLTAPRLALGDSHALDPIRRAIPSSGELLPVIGMGSSRTFDVSADSDTLTQLTEVMRIFFARKGALVDSSPMYGNAETVLGQILGKLDNAGSLFAATKVWTYGQEAGIAQMQESSRRMGVPVFDLMQIHNLRDWQLHLATLRRWKAEGKIRYLGITTSHQRFHEELEAIMRSEPLDFVQFSYNIDNRKAEERLLPLAADRGIATLINRPYQRGALFSRSKGKPLPDLATELGCESWGQFYLKFIIGHPAVTCLIPATSRPHHMEDNMGANFGPVPDAAQRKEMLRIFHSL
jgi:aryl-alcohol dehydrogenase-like predicted oxidoreductase